MKGTTIMKMIILMLSGMLISACMHLGMMESGDGHHAGREHQAMTDPVLEKEIIVGDLRAVATFPPLRLGEDVALTLKLMDARTGSPISGAEVYLHTEYMHRVGPDEQHAHPSDGRRENDINIDEQVTETSEPGVYAINYTSEQEGEYTLMFHVTAIGDHRLEPEITVEATRTLPGESHENQSDMMDGTSTTTYLIIGAAVMGAIMIAMLAVMH